jgi:hypothetical protein
MGGPQKFNFVFFYDGLLGLALHKKKSSFELKPCGQGKSFELIQGYRMSFEKSYN